MTKELMKATVDTLTSQQMQDKFKAALPAHISVEKFTRVTTTALNNNPKLLQCDRGSLFTACVAAAQDGLLPDNKEAALVQFGSKVAYMPMVGGVLKKVRNSGELKSLSANVVYEKDEFTYYVDENGEHFRHAPTLIGDRGKAVGVYAQAITTGGGVYFEFMSEADVKQVQGVAKSSNIWKQWAGEMWKKTAIRRLSKKLPMSTDVEDVIRQDDQFYDFDQKSEPRDITPEPTAAPVSDPSGLKAAMGIQDLETVPEAELVSEIDPQSEAVVQEVSPI